MRERLEVVAAKIPAADLEELIKIAGPLGVSAYLRRVIAHLLAERRKRVNPSCHAAEAGPTLKDVAPSHRQELRL